MRENCIDLWKVFASLGGRVVLCFFPYAFFRTFLRGFAQKQIGGIKGKGAEGERGDIDDGIHRPAEPGDDVPADDERAGFGTDVKHIDVRAGAVIAQRVDAEGDDAEAEIDGRGGGKSLSLFPALPLKKRYNPIKTRIMCQEKECSVSVQ